MVIKIPIWYQGSLGEKVLYTLFDSGATFSYIHPDHAGDLAILNKMKIPLEVATASVGNYLKIEERIITDFYIDDIRLSDEFMVIPGLSEDAIIGAATLQKWRIKLDFEHNAVIVDPKVAKAILKSMSSDHNLLAAL